MKDLRGQGRRGWSGCVREEVQILAWGFGGERVRDGRRGVLFLIFRRRICLWVFQRLRLRRGWLGTWLALRTCWNDSLGR
jgi:hypothetical protein